MALVWHEKTLPREDEQRQQQQDAQQRQQRQQQRQRFEEQRRQRQQRRERCGPMFCDSDEYDSCDYGSDDDDPYMDECMEEYVERMMGYGRSSYRQPPEGVRFGLPQLVVIPELHLFGGDAADKAVRKVGAGPAICVAEPANRFAAAAAAGVCDCWRVNKMLFLHLSRPARAMPASTASLLCFSIALQIPNLLVLAAGARCILLPACRASLRS
jgi:hypothetical protein